MSGPVLGEKHFGRVLYLCSSLGTRKTTICTVFVTKLALRRVARPFTPVFSFPFQNGRCPVLEGWPTPSHRTRKGRGNRMESQFILVSKSGTYNGVAPPYPRFWREGGQFQTLRGRNAVFRSVGTDACARSSFQIRWATWTKDSFYLLALSF